MVAAALALFAAPLLGHWLAVQSWGTRFLYEFALILMLPFCGFMPVAAYYAVFHRRDPREGLAWLALGVLGLGLFVSGELIGDTIRHRAFEQLAARSANLVAAITAYQTKYGAPPARLDDLVPEFLPSLPRTRMAAYPRYEYIVNTSPNDWEGNPWVLYVDCGQGGLNFDRFIYFPLRNYPQFGYGGSIEPIGAWGYVHE